MMTTEEPTPPSTSATLVAEVERLRAIVAHPTTLTALRAAYKNPSALGLGNGSDGWKLYEAAVAVSQSNTGETTP